MESTRAMPSKPGYRRNSRACMAILTSLTHARVVISSPNRTDARAKMFNVTIDLGVPGKQPIVIDNEADNADVFIALRDAFNAAQRKLDATAGKLGNVAKREQIRRKPAPNNDT